jgi:exodeoxyribonuclease VII large subunit
VPVLTGVGHEIDRSIADDVAHTAYKTPTACAVGIVTQVATYLDRADRTYAALAGAARRTLDLHDRQLRSTAEHCARATRGALAMHAVRIDHLIERIGRESDHLLVRNRSRVDRAEGRLTSDASRHLRGAEAAMAEAVEQLQLRPERLLSAAQRRLDTLAAQTRAHDPARTLARGWSITRAADGSVLRSAHDAQAGAPLVTTLADGTVHSTIMFAETPTTFAETMPMFAETRNDED